MRVSHVSSLRTAVLGQTNLFERSVMEREKLDKSRFIGLFGKPDRVGL